MPRTSDEQLGGASEKQRVWIELEYTVSALFLTQPNAHYEIDYPLQANYQDAHSVAVAIEPLPSPDGDRAGGNDAAARARVELSASPGIGEMLRELTEGRVPEGTKLPEPSGIFKEDPPFDPESRLIKEGRGVSPELLPEGLQSYIAQAVGEAGDYLRRTVRVMRWRQAGSGPHAPFAFRSQRFSLDDGESWHRLPAGGSADTFSFGSLSFRGTEWEEVVDLVAGGGDEPFSFELYREAWNQRTGNPRSALLLGIAAAEIGFKECVAALVPDAEWLVKEVPSPPLVRMLREYLPTLPVKNFIGGRVMPPLNEQLDLLRNGINRRNELVHRGGVTPSLRELRCLLEAIEEILWLLAYYRGWSWALRHLSLETRAALGDELTEAELNVLAQLNATS